MYNLLKGTWALFFGVGMMMLANGLQGSLIGIRASLEGYSASAAGIILTGYYAGFLLGALYIPQRIKNVGHVRTFAALASIASISILIHSLHISFLGWFIMRFISGMCFVGLYTVAESWVNDLSDNEHRGQALSVYMIVSMAGSAFGQLFLNIADPETATLFMIVSVLISISLVPILIVVSKQPDFSVAKFFTVKELYKASPLGVVTSIMTGLAHGTLWGIGSIYGLKNGLSIEQVSIFMFTFVIGGAINQYLVGYLSDKYDRRTIIVIVAFLASIFSVLAVLIGSSFIALIIITFIFGGLTVPLYPLAIAHTNDFLEKDEMVAASAGIQLAAGIGLTIGPIIGGLSIDFIGASGFWIYLFLIHALLGVFGLFRMQVREAVPLNEQGSTVLVSSRTTATMMELYPDAEESIDPVE
ncbi:MAG: MFS transporter [Candidatus Pelagibacterales bacterium]|jgi:MFS family permease|tara:strand:- start:130 stop:1374 length:1245 start_codon:yes stop_codon:yes gene_type:complete